MTAFDNVAVHTPSQSPVEGTSSSGHGHTTTTPVARETSNEHDDQYRDDDQGGANGKKKRDRGDRGTKRRKVNHACLYCRRSHMTCDEGRPCQRCLKREIGHLCHDEPRPPPQTGSGHSSSNNVTQERPAVSIMPDMSVAYPPGAGSYPTASLVLPPGTPSWQLPIPQNPFFYQSETFGNEFSVLTDFLDSLEERTFFNPPPQSMAMSFPQSLSSGDQQTASNVTGAISSDPSSDQQQQAQQQEQMPTEEQRTDETQAEQAAVPPILPAATKTERFLLTAADQESGSRDERLNRVIQAKYEAGLLKPYNYVKGYARLSRWMDRNVSQDSKQQILQPLSVLRPKFRAVAQSLTDIDLVFIEEAFERLLLDYDRVFSAMGIPACLWRRTGEIYKGNREFAELVGVDDYMLRDGRLCIYELMVEESAVNYWEKYGHIAFDSTQKAVLTSCVLRYRPRLSLAPSGQGTPVANRNYRKQQQPNVPHNEEGFINCCFSFTVRRDMWGIPNMIVGNFIKC